MKIENYPIVKLLFPYATGILIAYYTDYAECTKPILLILTGVFYLLTLLLTFVKAYRWRAVQTFAMNAAFVLAGILLTDMRLRPTLPVELMEKNTNWVVRVAEEPTLRKKSVKVLANIVQGCDKQTVKAKILLYLKPSADATELHYGDILFVHTKLSRIPPPCNPDAFDNQRYMQRRGIFYTGFVNEEAWERIGNKPANKLKYLSQKTRNKLTDIYISAGMSGEELDILKAILLGDDDTLDPELKASYSSAGVSHILCVSGMHVGVIFMIINFLLKPLDLFRRSRILKTILVMLVIWLYAHITGLAPSVTRSATMFTFVAIGQLLQRNTNIFHSLFASLFILLIIHPLLLFEVGFQLSYLAVTGIVLFQPKLSALYMCRTRIGNYFWELVTVSTAAQLGTSPVSIYYFAKFPNYFLLSNISVIALSFAVIITGIALLPLSLFPVITKYVSWLLTKEISIMNRIIRFIEHLPHSVTENIDYHIIQVVILYGVIGCVCLLLYRKSRKIFWSACTLFTLFCVSFAVRKIQLNSETGFQAYHIRKCSAIGFQTQGNMLLFSDSIRNKESELYHYNISNYAKKHHLKVMFVPIDTCVFDSPFLCKRGNFIRFNDKNYFILTKNQKICVQNQNGRPSIDCLLLRQNPRMPPDEMMALLPFKEVVADGSLSVYYVDLWRSFCAEKGIPFHYSGEEKEHSKDNSKFCIFAACFFNMINHIKGRIEEVNPAYVVIETAGGIGYYVNISLATFSEIKDKQEIKLLTHFIVKEDAQVLYGFATEEERELFKLLLTVNGIGPNTSRLILSSMSVGELLNAIATENVKAIQSVKGIGTKTAQRVIIELKDKAKKASWAEATKINASYNNNKYEALSALVALGFPKSGAEAVLDKIIKSEGIQLSVEELIKKSLKLL